MIYDKSTIQWVYQSINGDRDMAEVLDDQMYSHLICKCSDFWMIPNKCAPMCNHVGQVILDGSDAFTVNNRPRIATTRYNNRLSFFVFTLLGDTDNAGFSQLSFPTNPVNTGASIQRLGRISAADGRLSVLERVHEYVFEAYDHIRREGYCQSKSHPLLEIPLTSGFEKDNSKNTVRHNREVWADLYSMIQHGRCYECYIRELYEQDPDPFQSPW